MNDVDITAAFVKQEKPDEEPTAQPATSTTKGMNVIGTVTAMSNATSTPTTDAATKSSQSEAIAKPTDTIGSESHRPQQRHRLVLVFRRQLAL